MRIPPAARALLLAAPLLVHCATPRGGAPVAPAEVALGAPFRSEAGGYRVRFPAAPTESAQVNDGVRVHYAAAGAPGRSLGLVVGWCDHFPEAKVAPERIIDQELKSIVKQGDTVLEQRAVSVAGLPGRAFAVKHADGRFSRGRMFLRDARLYMMLAIGGDADTSAAAEEFFGSFALAGTGVADPPVPAAAHRVAFRDAPITLDMHGEPDRSEIPGTAGSPAGQLLAVRSRGGLRAEIATFHPIRAPSAQERKLMLDGVVRGMERRVGAVSDARELKVQGRPAREFRARVAELDAFYRVVALEDGPLVLQLLGPPGTVRPDEAAAFFRSVRLDGKR